MQHYLVKQHLIPYSKSWGIRCGTLDLFNGYANDSIRFLRKERNLNDDLLALKDALYDWSSGRFAIHVGESATLYRILQFNSWKNKLNKFFIKEGTLKTREICNDPGIVDYSQDELLKLDNGTSQWATAKVISGDEERITSPPPKLKLTYDAVEHWRKRRQEGKMWEPRYDETILRHAETYIDLLQGKRPKFTPHDSEDYCIGQIFDYITREEGEKRWGQASKHETNRFSEVENAIHLAETSRRIESKDHRVVQPIAVLLTIDKMPFDVEHPEAVNKSWPQFWNFLERYR